VTESTLGGRGADEEMKSHETAELQSLKTENERLRELVERLQKDQKDQGKPSSVDEEDNSSISALTDHTTMASTTTPVTTTALPPASMNQVQEKIDEASTPPATQDGASVANSIREPMYLTPPATPDKGQPAGAAVSTDKESSNQKMTNVDDETQEKESQLFKMLGDDAFDQLEGFDGSAGAAAGGAAAAKNNDDATNSSQQQHEDGGVGEKPTAVAGQVAAPQKTAKNTGRARKRKNAAPSSAPAPNASSKKKKGSAPAPTTSKNQKNSSADSKQVNDRSKNVAMNPMTPSPRKRKPKVATPRTDECFHDNEFFYLPDNQEQYYGVHYSAENWPSICADCGDRFGIEYKVTDLTPVYLCKNAHNGNHNCVHANCVACFRKKFPYKNNDRATTRYGGNRMKTYTA
jgi:hypothetical protein